MRWQGAFRAAYLYFESRIDNYWAMQLAIDYAEFSYHGVERKRGTMIFGSAYPYAAFK